MTTDKTEKDAKIAETPAETTEEIPPPPDYAVTGDQHLGEPVTLKAVPPPLPGEQPTGAPDEINPTGERKVEKDQVRPGTTAAPVSDGAKVPDEKK